MTPQALHTSQVDDDAAPIGGKLITPVTAVLAALVGVMCMVLFIRFRDGIGAATNLNDGYPWGLWIAWDVVIGTALGASGFLTAFLTYILNRGKYHPLVRPALLTALFGYAMAGASVFFDIGRYWKAYHVFMPRYAQFNSVLIEVALCILTYMLVLFIEFMPAVLERFGFERARKALSKTLFFFVALGVLLPTMHQSSLGSLLIVFGPQIDPIYQTRMLPFLFLTSTIGMGLAAVVLEGSISALALHRHLETKLLGSLMSIGRIVMAVFLVARFGNLAYRGMLGSILQPNVVVLMFWIETVLFAAPLFLLAGSGTRRASRVFLAAMSMALAGIMYRLDAFLVAYHTGAGWHYFPSMGEIAVTLGLIAFEILAFIVVIRLFPVMPKQHRAS